LKKPVCVRCNVEFRPEKTGVYVVEMYQKNQEIYQIWQADIWQCAICRAQVVFGFGNQPIMAHYDGDCNAKLEELKKAGAVIVYNKEVKWLDVKWFDDRPKISE